MATEKNTLETEVKLTGLTESEKRLDSYYKKLIETSIQEKKLAGDANFAETHQRKIAGADGAQNKFNQTMRNGAAAITAFIAGGALIRFLDSTIEKSREAATANRLLTSSATEAGLAYAELAQKNKEYADLAGVSNVQATATVSKLTQLATAAGRTDDISANNKKILDLAAARGVGGSEIENLAGQLLSGQDEALNRLGISDPSKLYAEFSAATGRSVESLSNMEQTAIRLDAVLKKGEIFSGAAELRLKSLDGQLDTTNAQIENLTSGISQSITSSLEFRDALDLISGALKGVSVNSDEVRQKLAKGLTPEQIAKEQTSGAGTQIFDKAKDLFNINGLTALLFAYDVATDGVEGAERRFIATVSGANQRRTADLQEQIANQKVLDDLQAQAAAEQRILNLRKERETTLVAETNALGKTGAALSVIENKIKDILNLKTGAGADAAVSDGVALQALKIASEARNKQVLSDQTEKVADLLRAGTPTFQAIADERRELFRASAYLNEKDYQNLDRQLSEFVKNSIKAARSEIEKLANQTDAFFADLFQRSNADNPFVKIFTDADLAIEKVRLSTAALSADLQKTALDAQTALNANALFSARITNDLQVFDYQQIAEKFSKAITQTAAPAFSSEFQNEFLQKREARFNDGAIRRDSFNLGNLTDEQKRSVFEREILADGNEAFGNGRFSELNKSSLITTLANNRFKADAGAPAGAGDIGERFSKQLEILRRNAPQTDAQRAELDRRILSLGSNLDPSKLSQSDRLEVARAAERQATRTQDAENAARVAIGENLPKLDSIDKNIAELLKIAKSDGLTGVVRIINDAGENVRSELGKRPSVNGGNSLFD